MAESNLKRMAALTSRQMDELMALLWAISEGYTVGKIENPADNAHPFITLTPPPRMDRQR